MLKKIFIGVGVVVVVAGLGLFVWARGVLAGDGVRTAVARQLSAALGQPVVVGGVHASVFPRVTMTLEGVEIGEPARIRVGSLHVGTDFGALLSRRIEHAALRVADARIELPLPPLALGAESPEAEPAPATDEAAAPAVELVSIDDITFSGVEIVSGGHTLRGDVEVRPRSGGGLDVRRVALAADDTAIEMNGTITDLAGPSGDLAVTAGMLNVDELMTFVAAFTEGAATSPSPAMGETGTSGDSMGGEGSSGIPEGVDIGLTVDADSAAFGDLTITNLSARGHLTSAGFSLDPVAFGVFDGRYEGSLALTPGETPAFEIGATLAGVDMDAVMAFAGTPGLMTGRLSGRIVLAGQGTTADAVLATTHGTGRVDIADGTVKGLGLVRGVVLATSMRDDSKAQLGSTSVDEPFSKLGATVTVMNGSARTGDLQFESPDLSLDAAGTVRLDGSAIDVKGRVRLSEALSAKAGRDLSRYAGEEGRVTLPASIGGSAENLQVRIDVADLAKRAITNKANQEVNKAIERNLPGILRR